MVRLSLVVIFTFILAACQTTNTGRKFVAVSPQTIGLSFWLPQYGFPAEFDNAIKRRENSAGIREVWHLHKGQYASLSIQDAVGYTYWLPYKTNSIDGAAEHRMGSNDLLRLTKTVIGSPLGNFNVGIYTKDNNYCMVAIQLSERFHLGFKKVIRVYFCSHKLIIEPGAKQILAGIGIDEKQPHMSLKPNFTRHDTLFRDGRPYNAFIGSFAWEGRPEIITALLKLEPNDKNGKVEFTYPGSEHKCFGEWFATNDDATEGDWSFYCRDGSEAFGTFSAQTQTGITFKGVDNFSKSLSGTLKME